MSGRLTTATSLSVAIVAVAVALGGCSKDESLTPAKASASTTAPTIASADPRSAIAGTWRSDEADWTVFFKDDGTFSEDFEGNVDFRTGTYRVKGNVVYLDGGDGVTDEGELTGDTINFKLGMLQRS